MRNVAKCRVRRAENMLKCSWYCSVHVLVLSPLCLLFFSRSFLLFKGVEGALFLSSEPEDENALQKNAKGEKKWENERKLVVSTKECLADMTNSDRGSPTLPFSSLSHQSSLCILSLEPGTLRSPYFTQEPVFFLLIARPLHALRNSSRKPKESHPHCSYTASKELPD